MIATNTVPVPQDHTRRNALIACLIAAFAIGMTIPTAFSPMLASSRWEVYANLLSGVIPTLAWLLGAVLVWQNRTELGVQVGLVPSLIAIPLTSYWSTGLGLANALAVGVGATLIAVVSLRPMLARWYIAASILAAGAAVILDILAPAPRLLNEQDATYINVVTVLTLLALSVLLLIQFRNYSLRTKLISTFVGLAILAVGGVTFAAQQAIRTSLTQNVAENLSARAQNTALSIGLAFDRNASRLQTLTLDDQVQTGATAQTLAYPSDPAAREALINSTADEWAHADPNSVTVVGIMHSTLSNTLHNFQNAFEDNQELFVTDQYGSLVASPDRLPQYNYVTEAWWQNAYNLGRGNVYISQPALDPMSNEYGITLALPVFDRARTHVVGVLHSFFSLNALQRTFLFNSSSQPGSVDIAFPQGQVLTSDGQFSTPLPDQIKEISEGFNVPLATLNYRGAPLLSSQAVVGVSDSQPEPYLRSTSWHTIALISPQEGLAVVDAASRAALIAGLVAIVGAILAAILLAQFLTRPIQRLTAVAEQVEKGNLGARAKVDTSDEIGTLASTFNMMTAQLQDTLSGLERRVAERTDELAQANLQLQSNSAYLSALNDTSTGLFQRLDSNDLLEAIVERAGALLGTQNGYIFYAEPGEDEIQLRVGTGLYDDLVGTRAQSGVGLAGTVWQTGKPLVIDDYQKWEGRLPGSRRDALRALVGIPLKRGEGETVGVIGLAYTDGTRKFGAPEVEILQRFAQLASIALDNAQLAQATQRQLAELATLNNISAILTSDKNLDDRIFEVGTELHTIFGVETVYLALYDAASKLIRMPFFMGEGRQLNIPPYDLGPGFTSHVIQTRQPLLINEGMETQVQTLEAKDSGEGQPDQSYLGVPIMLGDAVLGVIGLSDLKPNRFRDSDVRLLTTISAAIASAIQNASLFQQTREALGEAQRLAVRERESREQVTALNRRLTREGWRDYLDQLHSHIVVEAGEHEGNGNGASPQENGNGSGHDGDGANGLTPNGHDKIRVPISLRGEVIGEIELEPEDSEKPMTADDLGLVSHVAENIGLALDNARLYSETQRRVTELDALNRISQAVTSELDLETLLDVIGDQLRTIFDVQNVYIALYDRPTQMISLPYFVNDNKRMSVEPIRYGEGLTSHILRTRESLVINHHTAEVMSELGAKVVGDAAKSYMGVPILVADDVIGVISIQNIDREGIFDEPSVRLMTTIAATVGAAIQNAQLYGAMQREVYVRQRAEEEIKLSLKEKEVLLKEIHHRVKNNLQIISSLLNLQAGQLKDHDTSSLFRESQARVRSMALIHEKLYQSKDLARIDFDSYVRDLMVYLFRSYAANPDQIRTTIETYDMFLGIDTAIPCGLIISELVTNSLKYAFPNGARGEIYIGLAPEDDGHLTLKVNDNGIGFAPEFDWRDTDSLGLQLVSTLTTQLHGTIDVSGQGGTSFKITFPG